MDINIAAEAELFRGMDAAGIARCAAALNARTAKYEKGAVILSAGSVARSIGLVLSGSVTIESSDIWGNRTILSKVARGGLFAESYALLPGAVMLVDAVAGDDCEVLFLDAAPLRGATGADVDARLIINLLAISARKNLRFAQRSLHTAPHGVRARVLAYLNTAALQARADEFDIEFDRQQLADYLNVDRTALSKELSRLRAEGIIECRRSHFRLLNRVVD